MGSTGQGGHDTCSRRSGEGWGRNPRQIKWKKNPILAKPGVSQVQLRPTQGSRMSLAIVHSRATLGIEAPLVTVEVHLSADCRPSTSSGCRRLWSRKAANACAARSLMRNSISPAPHYREPRARRSAEDRRALRSGDRHRHSGRIGAAGTGTSEQTIFLGELALSGEVRRVNGILPALIASGKEGGGSIIPHDNQAEAGLLPEADIALCGHLLDLLRHFRDAEALPAPCAGRRRRLRSTRSISAMFRRQGQAPSAR